MSNRTDFKIPVEKLPQTAKELSDGNIWVDENESIYFLGKNGKLYKIIRYTTATDRDKMPRIITTIRGKVYYVSRMIAEAFLTNPYGETGRVHFKDGDSSNVRADNLEWVPQTKISKETCAKLWENAKLCPKCRKRKLIGKKKLCNACQRKQDQKKFEADRRKQEAKQFAKIPKLKERQKKIIALYGKGKNYAEIAKEIGVTSQAISFAIHGFKSKIVAET